MWHQRIKYCVLKKQSYFRELQHDYILRPNAVHPAGDDESVNMLNDFREHYMFDLDFAESSVKAHFLLQTPPNKRERATGEKSAGERRLPRRLFPSTRPRRPYCVSKQIDWLARRRAGLRGVRMHRAPPLPGRRVRAAGGETRPSSLDCCLATVSFCLLAKTKYNFF